MAETDRTGDIARIDSGSNYRAALVALLLAIATIAAVWIGILFSGTLGTAVWIGPTLLVLGLLLLTWALVHFVLLVPTLLHFVRCGRVAELPVGLLGPGLVGFSAIVLLSAFGARASALNARPGLTILSTFIPVETVTDAAPPPVEAPPIEPARDFFMIPFSTDEGRSKTCSDDDPAFGDAQNLPPALVPTIKVLVGGLAACARGENVPEIDVRGFASSSGFRSCPTQGESEELNLRLAERRRASVIAAVRANAGPDLIRIFQEDEARRWPSVEEMRRNVRIVDFDQAGYSPLRGNLTRRAEIVITHKGACEETVETPPAPPLAALQASQ